MPVDAACYAPFAGMALLEEFGLTVQDTASGRGLIYRKITSNTAATIAARASREMTNATIGPMNRLSAPL